MSLFPWSIWTNLIFSNLSQNKENPFCYCCCLAEIMSLTFSINLRTMKVSSLHSSQVINCLLSLDHGLRTPNEGINQRYLKNWADVADKICCRHTKKVGSGSEFSAVQWRLFPLWASVVRALDDKKNCFWFFFANFPHYILHFSTFKYKSALAERI